MKVRRKLENHRLPLPMDQHTYRALSGLSIHVNPKTSPQIHNPLSLPTLGAYFQGAGALLALNQPGNMVGWLPWLSVKLVEPPIDRKVIVAFSVKLFRSIGGINLNTIQDYFNQVQKSSQSGRCVEHPNQ